MVSWPASTGAAADTIPHAEFGAPAKHEGRPPVVEAGFSARVVRQTTVKNARLAPTCERPFAAR